MADIKIIQGYPPNYQQIASNFPVTENQIYAYYPNIYKTREDDIEPSILLHENIHCERQKHQGVEKWWYNYIMDKDFRLEEELCAFGAQYAFAQTVYRSKQCQKMLHEMSVNLSSPLYGNIIDKNKAECLIRLRAKEYGDKT